MIRWILLFVTFWYALGCTSNNTVQHIESNESVVKYKNDEPENTRFANLYPGKKSYPFTCTENCYPISTNVICQIESPAENCFYQGEQHVSEIAAGFSIKWLGHASFYIEAGDGTTFLIDPVSKQFDWPVNWAFRLQSGFNRKAPVWLDDQQESAVNGVMYSHVHYDHFNKDDMTDIGTNSQ
jgi:N-acyl-phosphatidylethanolamine-hydrolysing phospholipase D